MCIKQQHACCNDFWSIHVNCEIKHRPARLLHYVLMPFVPSICFERVSYILVSTEYLSNVACNGQEVKSIVVSRGVCYYTEFDLVSSFFAPRLSVVFVIIGMLHGFLCRKGLNSLAFRSEMTGFEMIPDMLVENVFPAVFFTLGPQIFSYSFRRCKISIFYFSPA